MGDKHLAPKSSTVLQKLWSAEREILSKPLTKEELNGFGRQKTTLPNPRPFIRFEDLNNKTEHDIEACNPKKPSVCVGLEWSF